LKEGLRGLIDALPDGDRLCHGDFHPANVLLTASGPVVIDWVDATRGHPLADVARTLVILRLGRPQIRVPRLVIAAVRYALVGVYQRRYASRSPVDWAEVRRWLAVVAAARLCEGVPGERERLLTLVRAALRG
jgi:aminoglycoside phosphotransferase (APT) family kinase protein